MTQLARSTTLPNPTRHFLVWQDLIVHHGGYWMKLIRRATAHACLQRQNTHHATELHAKVGKILLDEQLVHDIPRHVTQAG